MSSFLKNKLVWLLLVAIFATGCEIEEVSAVSKQEQPLSVQSTDESVSSLVSQACELIYRGQFDKAGQLLTESKSSDPAVSELKAIISRHQSFEMQRQIEQQKAYEGQLQELTKLEANIGEWDEHELKIKTTDGSDIAGPDLMEDIAGASVDEPKDVNDISHVFTAILKAREYANENQKKELMENSFVKETVAKAREEASRLEAEGKWLDSYIVCYSWLAAIYEDNQAYEDYAEELLEKASIVAAFQDSPCETLQERYTGIKKDMFTRAVDALNFSYVSIIDYSEMALEAINRCRLLGEVVAVSYEDIIKDSSAVNGKISKPSEGQLAAWKVGLAGIKKDVTQNPMGLSKDQFVSTFEKTLAVNKATVNLPEEVLIAHFSEAAFGALDPYTVMVWPKQVQDFEKMMTNEFTGIGVEISKEKGLLTVSSLLLDTPAFNSGLDAEDVIEEVDGLATKDMSINCAVKNITGPAGTKVKLKIHRPSEDRTFEVTITRARIVVPTIRGWQRSDKGNWEFTVDDKNKIGYIRITSFSERTSEDFDKVLTQMEKQGLRGLILDLRYNSGGLLHSAIDICDKFVSEGLIVRTQPRFGVPTYASATKKSHPDYPIVVLVNGGSASASEIVAGCLGDPKHNRAILVGERTHGKGLVQGITHHPGGGAQLKYTMAHYHLPSGQRVEGRDAMEKLGRTDWGVGPQVEIKVRTDELRKMLEVRRNNEVLVKADHNAEVVPLKKHTLEETIQSDPQLEIGLLVVKAQLIERGTSANSSVTKK